MFHIVELIHVLYNLYSLIAWLIGKTPDGCSVMRQVRFCSKILLHNQETLALSYIKLMYMFHLKCKSRLIITTFWNCLQQKFLIQFLMNTTYNSLYMSSCNVKVFLILTMLFLYLFQVTLLCNFSRHTRASSLTRTEKLETVS